MPNARSCPPDRSRSRGLGLTTLATLIAWACLGACSQKGTITFEIEAPSDPRLSPLADPRRDFVSAFDEMTGLPLGRFVTTAEQRGVPQDIGDIPVGTYDVRLNVLGGGQLIGVARTPHIEVLPLAPRTATLSVRKPLLFYMSQEILNFGIGAGLILPLPFPPLLALDATRPEALPGMNLPVCKNAESCPGVTATTRDGKLLLIATPGRLLVLASGALYDADSNHRILAAATLAKGVNEQAPPRPREIAVNADTSAIAVVTNQGVNLARLADLLSGATVELGTLQFPSAMGTPLPVSSAAWAPDNTTLTVLAGPTWDKVACNDMKPTATYEVTLEGYVSDPATAPAAATDIVYGPDRQLLFAAPCGAGLVHRDGNVPTIGGTGISQILIAGGRVFGIPSGLTTRNAKDPDNPVTSLAHLQSYIPGGADHPVLDSQTVDFEVPSELINFPKNGQPVLIRLQPTDLVAYDFAATPDSGRVIIASRAYYEAKNYSFFEIINPVTTKRSSYCTLDVTRHVFRLTEIDTSVSGPPLYERVVGVSEISPCKFLCYTSCDANGACRKEELTCSLADGFVPTGLSLAFGSY